ncbi:hypothetical protein PFICI_06805 [Pestalotiopsis fici W106-1]|uniref:DUF6594 domain-containing protein n=1 Tax=Pestalotiopsis fici (strain W106-1 / CGMCC3.15140) TaxID=1229662 RepID=W3X6R7_PESFW|nr:uncharacterized protein PFICI_06805 [Pestalotiopsis fici W106-1]ETS81803.1 hypothetical protein PFICI_06805 [Pestalotiopsis fici W106-1]
MNQAGLAEQGAIPLPSIPAQETSQRELLSSSPTVPSVSEEHTSTTIPAPRTENQGNTISQTSQSGAPSTQQGAKPPIGWPTIAAKQSRQYNTGNLRKFDVLNRRVLVDDQTKIWALEKILHEKDNEDAQHNLDGLTKLPFNPADLVHTGCVAAHQHLHLRSTQSSSRASSEQSEQSDEEFSRQPSEQASSQTSGSSSPYSCPQYTKDQVMEALSYRLTKYCMNCHIPFQTLRTRLTIANYKDLLMILSRHVESLPRVSSYSYKNFESFVGKDSLEGDAWKALMDEEEDFITTRKDMVHEKFEWLMHGQPRFGLDKIFMAIFRQKGNSTDSDDKNKYVSPKKLEIFTKIIIGLFCMGMLVGPVGILLLVPLTDAQSFGLVVGFSSVVVFGLSGLDSFYATLVAFSTYTAVLVTSLSNLYQARIH